MNKIRLTWKEEADRKYIECDLISQKIEISSDEKEIKNTKKVFQEIIYVMFLNNNMQEIELVSSDLEITEVTEIVTELINVCNEKIKAISQQSDN